MPDPKNLIAALAYARKGWQVFAIRPKSKTPLTLHGFHDATTDPFTIRKWWAKNPACGVGIATGRKSNIIVLDVDPRNQGDETFESLELKYGDFPGTVESRTGGGGRHLIFQCPPGVWPGGKGLWQGIDIKADGGYIVAPHSVHPTGFEYRWKEGKGPRIPGEEGGLDPAPCPTWLLKALQERLERRVAATKERHPDDTDKFTEGSRNDALISLAGTMRRRGMSQAAILAALLAENEVRCDPPISKEEIANITESICRYDADPDAKPKQVSREAKEGTLLRWADPVQMGLGKEPEIEWILDGWLAKNDCSLFFGPPGAGKSWIMLDLAITCCTGQPTFGYFDRGGEILKVLIVDEENPHEEVWRRVHKLLTAWEIDPELLANQLYLTYPCQGFTFANESYTYALQREVEKIQPDVIIFDSVTALSGIRKEADAVEIRSFFHDKLYPLRAVCNSCIVCVHHSNKGIYQHEQQVQDAGLARGSIDFLAAPDSVWMLKPTGTQDLLVKSNKVRRGKIPDSFHIRIVDGEKGGARPLVVSGNGGFQKQDNLTKKTEDAIISILTERKAASKEELKMWVGTLVSGISDATMKRALGNLIRNSIVKTFCLPKDHRKSIYSLKGEKISS